MHNSNQLPNDPLGCQSNNQRASPNNNIARRINRYMSKKSVHNFNHQLVSNYSQKRSRKSLPPLYSQGFIIPIFPRAKHIDIGVNTSFRHNFTVNLQFGPVDLIKTDEISGYRMRRWSTISNKGSTD